MVNIRNGPNCASIGSARDALVGSGTAVVVDRCVKIERAGYGGWMRWLGFTIQRVMSCCGLW